ncbi:DUF2842 domain-containing protein [Sagittula sp. NFXS13]|uniref:Membrane protein implicated in regulation of membrane protease activity n=1 Tax=Sagittula marina TaxID=943940 RepID=A0A7W6DPU4_9RHOB|nr:DUF2842 domain-containing protein [Sagittula marina]MBB3984525.1 membrane protein implicated in regulation of membrane protease activity [Sagittula marina]
MELSYKARRRWSLVLLIFGLPAYIAAVWFLLSLFDRPPLWLEFIIYVALGVVWALPFKFVFKGVGQADPDADPVEFEDDGLK